MGKSGVIGFVTNAGFIEANTADGLRKCLADEFSNLHLNDLGAPSCRSHWGLQGSFAMKADG